MDDRRSYMLKGDRIAIVLSIAWFVFVLLMNNGDFDLQDVLGPMIPVFIYWGYRFVKGR